MRSMVLSALCAGIVMTFVGCGQAPEPVPQPAMTAKNVGVLAARIPAGGEGIGYADLDTPEALSWGPPGIFTVGNGYVIPDNVGRVLVKLREDFTVEREIDLDGVAVGIFAVAQDGEDLVALDAAAPEPALIRISSANEMHVSKLPSFLRHGLTGLVADDDGLVLEVAGGERLYRISEDGPTVSAVPVPGYFWNGKLYSVDLPNARYFHERTVRLGGAAALIRAKNHLGLVQIIGPDMRGGAYVLAEDVVMMPMVSVEQAIWHLAANGDVLGVASVPIDERITTVARGVTDAVRCADHDDHAA